VASYILLALNSAGLYVGWLLLFERLLEPIARRALGTVMDCTIVWVPAGRFRVWGTREAVGRQKEATIALAGSLVALSAAAAPVAALHTLAHFFSRGRESLQPGIYLLSVPLMMLFVVRLLGAPIGRR
jgi:hypothetical protein